MSLAAQIPAPSPEDSSRSANSESQTPTANGETETSRVVRQEDRSRDPVSVIVTVAVLDSLGRTVAEAAGVAVGTMPGWALLCVAGSPPDRACAGHRLPTGGLCLRARFDDHSTAMWDCVNIAKFTT
jgi:hypothetical protein